LRGTIQPIGEKLLLAFSPLQTEFRCHLHLLNAIQQGNSTDAADEKFIVVAGTNEVDYEEINSESERELKIAVPAGTTRIEIVGTQVVPEFPLGIVVLIISMSAIAVVTSRRKILVVFINTVI